MLGTHKIEIVACQPLNDTQSRWHAPKKYSNPTTSGLTQQIDGPKRDLVINLTWNGGTPFVETHEADPLDRPGAKKKSTEK
jgi:hypothetical protein